MSTNILKIGMCEFRAYMPRYLLAPEHVAITHAFQRKIIYLNQSQLDVIYLQGII
jgi:hypothetical protein